MYFIQYVYYMYVIWHIYILLIPKRLVRLKNSGLSSWFFEKKILSSLKPCKCNKTICTVMVQFQKLHTQKKSIQICFKDSAFFLNASYNSLLLAAVQRIAFLVFVFFYKRDFQNFMASPILLGEHPPVWVLLLFFCILNSICVL